MTDKKLCKLCQTDLALEIDLEKSSYKFANSLLRRLFECYNIDVSILGESPCTCKPCFEGVLQISEQLEKWSNAQKVLEKASCLLDMNGDTGDSVISVKEEPKTLLWDENDDAEFTTEDSLELLTSNDFEFLDEGEDLEFIDEEEEPQTDQVEILDGEEPQTEEFLDEKETRTGDVESLTEPYKNHADGVSAKVYEELFEIEQVQEKSTDTLDWRSTPHKFFCVCLGPDGLAIAVLFKDKTPKRNVRMLCTCCNQVFATVSDIQKHSLVSRAHPEYWCRSCGIYFSNITELKFHEEYQNHRLVYSNLVIRCLKCAKISTEFLNAIRHENTVHDKSSYDCKKCSLSFHSSTSLAKHQWKHMELLCHYTNCCRKFKLWEKYLSHLKWHTRFHCRCPVQGCNGIMEPGNHVSHLRSHRKSQVKFYNGVELSSRQGTPVRYLINTRKA